MKRLKSKLLSMDPNTTTYTETIVLESDKPDYDSVYYYGEYLSVADTIYKMDEFQIYDVTEKRKQISNRYYEVLHFPQKAVWTQNRILYSDGFSSYPADCGSERLAVSEFGFIIIEDERIHVRGLHDIISPQQVDALGFMLRYMMVTNQQHIIDLPKSIDTVYDRIEAEGLDFLYSSFFTACNRFFALPRKQGAIGTDPSYEKHNI